MVSDNEEFENFVRTNPSEFPVKRKILNQNNNSKKIIIDKDFLRKAIIDKNISPIKDLTVGVNTASSNAPIAPFTTSTEKNSHPPSQNLYGDDETGESYVFIELRQAFSSKL
uniref:Uncharacterized protein n=1 Tax=Glossina pallidipes TaxID=7398 RepID=A0A1A9ZTM7_GLOPL